VREALQTMLASLRQHDTAAIMAAGGLPRVAIGTTGDVRMLTETVDRIPPTDSPGRLDEAVELARRLAHGGRRLEIVILTDGADEAAAQLLDEEDVTVYGFGKESPNIGITSFQVRRNIADVTSYQVMVEVTNFGEEAAR